MFARSLSLLAVTAFVAAAAATPAAAGCCGCAYTCAPPPQVQYWGLTPSYLVNQGPVFSGPGIYTSPTYEGEVSTADYPYVGYGDYPRYYRPYEGGPYSDPFRHHVYHSYWGGLPERPHHFAVLERRETGVIYRRGFGSHSIMMSGGGHWMSRDHREFRERHEW
jgi:hypothetical protein